MSGNFNKNGSIGSPILEYGKSTNANMMSKKEKSVDKNRLGLFKIKPIASFLTSDDQFEFMIKLGEKVKHLQPVPPEVILEAENDRLLYESKLL